MSKYATLIVNDIPAHVFDVTALPLNIKRRITNSSGEAAGDFTRSTLTVPATKVNKDLFENELSLLPFRIEVNGSIKISGSLQVKKKIKGGDCYKIVTTSYQLALFSGSTDWFKLLRDCKLRDLTEEIKVFDTPDITAGLNADPLTAESGFLWIKFKEWENSKNTVESNPFGPGNIPRQLDMPSYFETTPFLFIRPLVIAAFNKIGYTVNSSFLDSNFFRRLILPVPLPDKLGQQYSEDYLNFEASEAVENIPVSAVTNDVKPYNTVDKLPTKNPTAWNVITYEYTAAEAGYYEIELGAQFGPQIGTFNFVYTNAVAVNNVILDKDQGGAGFGKGSLIGASVFPTNKVVKDSSVFELQKGDVITIQRVYGSDTPFTILNSYVRITGEAIRTQGITIDFNSILAGLEFMPMLRDLQRLFNLGFDTNNENRSVLIEPLDPYRYTEGPPTNINEVREGYYFINNAIDYGQKVDYSQGISCDIPQLPGFFNFSYEQDDEETIKFVEQNNEFLIYEAEYSSPDGSEKDKTEQIKTEFFVKTIHVRDILARAANTEINPQFPLIYDDNYILNPTLTTANYDVSPRLLYFAGQRGGIDGYITVFENQGVDTEAPAAFMVNYNDATGNDPSLSWATESINNIAVPGLVARYYSHYLKRRSLRENLKLFFLQNSIELDNFTFRNKADLFGDEYIIQEFEVVNPLQGLPDQFLLIRAEYADAETIDSIINTLLSGVVGFIP